MEKFHGVSNLPVLDLFPHISLRYHVWCSCCKYTALISIVFFSCCQQEPFFLPCFKCKTDVRGRCSHLWKVLSASAQLCDSCCPSGDNQSRMCRHSSHWRLWVRFHLKHTGSFGKRRQRSWRRAKERWHRSGETTVSISLNGGE